MAYFKGGLLPSLLRGCVGDQALAQVARLRAVASSRGTGCGISHLGDLQKPPGCGPGHPALCVPAQAGAWTR